MINVSLIVAMGHHQVIGRNGKMPWHLPADLAYFKRVTYGKPIIMGRKTFDSIGRPLPGRQNIVLTRDDEWHAEGVEVFHDLNDAFASLAQHAEIMVIGGAEIYRMALPHANKLYITEIDADEPGDTVFPKWDKTDWLETNRESFPAIGQTPAYSFVIYEKSC